MDFPKEDKKFYIEKPDADFSPQHNREVVENSIKKYEAMQLKKWKETMDKNRERADAVVTYLKAIDKGATTRLDHFFSPKELSRLRGDDIRLELTERLNAKKKSKRL